MAGYNIILVHGSYGSRDENWFPWLRSQLHKLRRKKKISKVIHVRTPQFPTPEGQELDSWLSAFKRYRRYVNERTIFVGHSLGPAFILNLLERLDKKKPVRGAFLVAGFIGKLGITEFDGINDTFTNREFNWGRIKRNCRSFRVYASDNDPYVPLKLTEQMAKRLRRKVRVVKGAGHFNKECGFTEFDKLLREIRTLLRRDERRAPSRQKLRDRLRTLRS